MIMPAYSHHTLDILDRWFTEKDSCRWVLGTIVQVQGSAYRKPGAIMLINEHGATLGLLSGGCLESDLARQAQRFLASVDTLTTAEASAATKDKKALSVPAEQIRYDSQDEDEMLFKLGLGCGGIVDILLQPVNRENNYLSLEEVRQQLHTGKGTCYRQRCEIAGGSLGQPLNDSARIRFWSHNTLRDESQPVSEGASVPLEEVSLAQSVSSKTARRLQNHAALHLETTGFTLDSWIPRKPRLGIFGGGIDAVPLAEMANYIGWEVLVHDTRPSHARREMFSRENANGNIRLLKTPLQQALDCSESPVKNLDAAVIMYHNTALDAQALKILSQLALSYCALLGPRHRKQEVLELAGLEESDLRFRLHGPAGLDIGAQLPESIGLSILTQCHAALFTDEH